MTDSVRLADQLMMMYIERARKLDHIDRFYLYLDPEIREIEEQVDASDSAGYFRERLLSLYELWLLEMSPAQRAAFFTHNARSAGAVQNHLVEEEERLQIYKRELRWSDIQQEYLAGI